MATSVVAPAQTDTVAVEAPAKARSGDAMFLFVLALAELAWVAMLLYGLLSLID